VLLLRTWLPRLLLQAGTSCVVVLTMFAAAGWVAVDGMFEST
jgi:hypothetical protein